MNSQHLKIVIFVFIFSLEFFFKCYHIYKTLLCWEKLKRCKEEVTLEIIFAMEF